MGENNIDETVDKVSFSFDIDGVLIRIHDIVHEDFIKENYPELSKHEAKIYKQVCVALIDEFDMDRNKIRVLREEFENNYDADKDQETIQLDKDLGKEFWKFIAEKPIWGSNQEELLNEHSKKVKIERIIRGRFGTGVYDKKKDIFRKCESGGHFHEILSLIHDGHPTYKEYLEKDYNGEELTDEEDKDITMFILGNFHLVESNQRNPWRRYGHQASMDYTRVKTRAELKELGIVTDEDDDCEYE